MKTGKSLTELAAEIERQAKSKQDFIVNTKALTMTEDGRIAFGKQDQGADNAEFNGNVYDTNSIAHGQIAANLDIPAKYYNRLLSDDKGLLATNVNHWLHAKPQKRMVRTLDGNARAFLSDKFHLGMENFDVAEAVLPVLLEGGANILSAEITESRLYIKAVMPKIEGQVTVGDVVQAGVSISNSEVGMGALTIQPLIYRLVCTNGAIFPDSKFSSRHVGARKGIGSDDNFAHLLTNEALVAEDRALSLRVRDVIRGTLSEAAFQQRIDLMREAKGEKITGDVPEVVEVTAKRFGLNDFERSGILRHLIEEGDLSKYGLHNAITRTSQDIGSYDRATELETLGGSILSLNRSEWKVISEAA